jgi:hypothetical protein
VVKWSTGQIFTKIRKKVIVKREPQREEKKNEIKETQRVQDHDVRKKQSSSTLLAPFD